MQMEKPRDMSVILTAERQLLHCKAVNKTHRTSLPGVGRLLNTFYKFVKQRLPLFFSILPLKSLSAHPSLHRDQNSGPSGVLPDNT
jgi:hypothetical protein